jgi:hypothetical protein
VGKIFGDHISTFARFEAKGAQSCFKKQKMAFINVRIQFASIKGQDSLLSQ